MSGAVDRLVPSVEVAAKRLEVGTSIASGRCLVAGPLCPTCAAGWQAVEAASVALDMALAQESDARRAEADRLRAEVAW